jgi:hypothetical protein
LPDADYLPLATRTVRQTTDIDTRRCRIKQGVDRRNYDAMPNTWRLKLLDCDNVIEASHPFSDLKALLVAARRVAAARSDLRLVITVPANALEEDRERVRQIADRL